MTHDQEEALEVADKIVLMNKGRIEQTGSQQDIYETPATSFAYSFIGNVNAFKGRVEGGCIRIGDDRLLHGTDGLNEGREVVAYARPHDIDIIADTQSNEGIAASVNRILYSGALSRVVLIATNSTGHAGPA